MSHVGLRVDVDTLRGTLWPGAVIGKRCPGPIRQVVEAGHEVSKR
jgi:hypothetical protein